MRTRILAALLLALSAVHAAAENEVGWYGTITSGYLWAEGHAGLVGTTQSVYGGSPTFDMDDGGSLALALGRRLPMGWRIEGELSFLRAGTDTGIVHGMEQRLGDTFRLDGDIDSTVFMVNGLFDFDVRNERFTPYLKVGAGIARNEASASLDVQFDAALWTGTSREGVALDGHAFPDAFETHFAWNAGVGLRTPLTDRFLLALEYGFIDPGEAATGPDGGNDAIVWTDLAAQRFLLGLDFRF